MAGFPKRRAFDAAMAEVVASATGDEPTEQAIDDWLIERVTQGDTAATICRDIEQAKAWKESGFEAIGAGMLYRWLGRNPDIDERYSRARKRSAHAHADKVADIAAGVTEANARSKAVALKGHQWLAEKRNRDEYGVPNVSVTNNLDVGQVLLQVLQIANQPGAIPPPSTSGNHGDTVETLAAGAIEPPPSSPGGGVEENTGTQPPPKAFSSEIE